MESDLQKNKRFYLGDLAKCYGYDLRTFKKRLSPLIKTRLQFLKTGKRLKLTPEEIRLVCKFLGDYKYRMDYPRITIKKLAEAYDLSSKELNKNIDPIRKQLQNNGYDPQNHQISIQNVRDIIKHLGLPEDEILTVIFNPGQVIRTKPE